MMIEPVSGFAPPQWQAYIGPVVVWRPDGAVSSHDMALLNDYLSELLDRYSEGDVIPQRDITPAAWASAKIRFIEGRRPVTYEGVTYNEGMMQYTDINI